ncbi:hypothetical protein B0H17DRAFT_1196928 [Mycena rosella]|uniref:Uncharacterized protein n=1 Tax=Mycena rosella TaxID=1033263 RepID=A0AAD7DRY5_MYCRO|nr:hypothetical protein B0H17DRAFT_1196928 [Mycena rosella]
MSRPALDATGPFTSPAARARASSYTLGYKSSADRRFGTDAFSVTQRGSAPTCTCSSAAVPPSRSADAEDQAHILRLSTTREGLLSTYEEAGVPASRVVRGPASATPLPASPVSRPHACLVHRARARRRPATHTPGHLERDPTSCAPLLGQEHSVLAPHAVPVLRIQTDGGSCSRARHQRTISVPRLGRVLQFCSSRACTVVHPPVLYLAPSLSLCYVAGALLAASRAFFGYPASAVHRARGFSTQPSVSRTRSVFFSYVAWVGLGPLLVATSACRMLDSGRRPLLPHSSVRACAPRSLKGEDDVRRRCGSDLVNLLAVTEMGRRVYPYPTTRGSRGRMGHVRLPISCLHHRRRPYRSQRCGEL